jgi:hypothetical protein
MDLNKLVEAIDGSTHSLRQSQKVPQGATAPGSADTTKHALRLNNYVKSSIFQNHDTIADRAHATNKAIDQLFSKYYRPTYYPDGDWRNWERMADVDNILKLAQGWFELAKARLAEVVGNQNECDADLIKYLNSQQGSANRTMVVWKEVRDGREASMTDHSSVQQYGEKDMKGRNVEKERNIDT